mmetsp:Transcript_8304/g.15035  ORF Transcript_8304/g.15035 Transcript_8304/m.15035 type:complete len:217 (-) Transcript_8304:745-1395(-)
MELQIASHSLKRTWDTRISHNAKKRRPHRHQQPQQQRASRCLLSLIDAESGSTQWWIPFCVGVLRKCARHACWRMSWCCGARTPSRKCCGVPKLAHHRTGHPAFIASSVAFSATSADPQSTNTQGTHNGECTFTCQPKSANKSCCRFFHPGNTLHVFSMYSISPAADSQNACARVLHDHGVCSFLNVLYHFSPHATDPNRNPGHDHSFVHEFNTIN